MKLAPLTVLLPSLLPALIRAAPSAQPLEIVVSIDGANQRTDERGGIPDALAILYGATPEDVHTLNVPVNVTEFKIDWNHSISYITLQGFAGCIFSGKDGSKTYLKSYGIPQTVPVGPPQVQVSGFCVDPNRLPKPPGFGV